MVEESQSFRVSFSGFSGSMLVCRVVQSLLRVGLGSPQPGPQSLVPASLCLGGPRRSSCAWGRTEVLTHGLSSASRIASIGRWVPPIRRALPHGDSRGNTLNHVESFRLHERSTCRPKLGHCRALCGGRGGPGSGEETLQHPVNRMIMNDL